MCWLLTIELIMNKAKYLVRVFILIMGEKGNSNSENFVKHEYIKKQSLKKIYNNKLINKKLAMVPATQ